MANPFFWLPVRPVQNVSWIDVKIGCHTQTVLHLIITDIVNLSSISIYYCFGNADMVVQTPVLNSRGGGTSRRHMKLLLRQQGGSRIKTCILLWMTQLRHLQNQRRKPEKKGRPDVIFFPLIEVLALKLYKNLSSMYNKGKFDISSKRTMTSNNDNRHAQLMQDPSSFAKNNTS
jgi:hypothetical protein